MQVLMRPGARVVYLSSERFMNEYVNAIRSGRKRTTIRRWTQATEWALSEMARAEVAMCAANDA